jgi:hypothetical protein
VRHQRTRPRQRRLRQAEVPARVDEDEGPPRPQGTYRAFFTLKINAPQRNMNTQATAKRST